MSPAKPLARQDLELILERTAPLWEEVRGQRFLLTGGTGFFGCWLVESFCFANERLGLGAEATLLTRNPEAFTRKCPHLASSSLLSLYSNKQSIERVDQVPPPVGGAHAKVERARETLLSAVSFVLKI